MNYLNVIDRKLDEVLLFFETWRRTNNLSEI
jgi:hypothetical protein